MWDQGSGFCQSAFLGLGRTWPCVMCTVKLVSILKLSVPDAVRSPSLCWARLSHLFSPSWCSALFWLCFLWGSPSVCRGSLTTCLEIEQGRGKKHTEPNPGSFCRVAMEKVAFLEEVGLVVGNVCASSTKGVVSICSFLWYLNPVGHIRWLKEKSTKPWE